MQKRCFVCGRYFTPDRRVGDRQTVCGREACRKDRKKRAQRKWVKDNPEHCKNHYVDYVKPWRRKQRQARLERAGIKDGIRAATSEMIKDKIPPLEPYQELILRIPAVLNGVIKDEIRLRRVDTSTFAAYGP